MFNVGLSNKAAKQFSKLSKTLKEEYHVLFSELVYNPFKGKLSENEYHTHVKYHWVAIWKVDKTKNLVTVTYIGSRENAPY